MNPVVLVVPLALSIFAAIGRRSNFVSKQGVKIFACPGALVCFLALSSSLITFAPLWIPFVKPQIGPPAIEDYLFFGIFGGLGMVFAAYLYCYRGTVGPDIFAVGAFSRTHFRLADIREVRLQKGQRSGQLFVYMRSGKRLRFSGLLSGFEALSKLLVRPSEP